MVLQLQDFLDEKKDAIVQNPELAEAERELRMQIDREARDNLERMRAEMRARREAGQDDDWDDFNDDDYDVEVEYVQ